MSRLQAKETAIINATPEQVYAVFRDYEDKHPRILPRDYFSEPVLEQGGQGAGTIFRVKVRVMGQETSYHMVVSEPAPGRTLVETDLDTGLVTTFSVLPTAQPQQAQVEIATIWDSQPGIAGLFERFLAPPVMRQIYRKELALLENFLQQ